MPTRALLGVLAILVAACGSTGNSSTTSTTVLVTTTAAQATTTIPTVTTTTADLTTTTVVARFQIVNGVFQGPESFSVGVGETFTIEVVSDADGELHVHGYDLLYELVAGEPALIEFVAEAPGVFDVELEGTHAHLFVVEVGG